ncbi:MAG: putative DNA-binding domain-containing protein [Novosphingobium sp.]
MSLLATQRSFLAEIAADDDAPPSSLGMAIYRNAYRARLSDALAVSFERTRRWVGEDLFNMAAAHYILAHPPSQWTLDAFGDRFPEALEALFAKDPEVAALAWLEWQMQQAFAAPDRSELTAAQLGAAGLVDADWAEIRFTMAAGFASRPVRQDLARLWHSLSEDGAPVEGVDTAEPQVLIVWRQHFSPRFRLIDQGEAAVLDNLSNGVPFGQAASGRDPDQLGQWLAAWLTDGLFSAFSIDPATDPAVPGAALRSPT